MNNCIAPLLAQRDDVDLTKHIREIPNFPKPGIMFRDITPLLANPDAFRELVAQLAFAIKESGATTIVGLESRGFIFGVAAAQTLGIPFVPARKAGKLPGETVSVGYALEYGEQRLELQKGSLSSGDKVAIVDDLLATGGTANAAAALVRKLGAQVAGFFFAIELRDLNGRTGLNTAPTFAVISF